MFLYSIYDVVLEEFAPPFIAKNDKAASRMFLQGIRKMSNPNDLSLWMIGAFNAADQYMVVDGCKPVQIPVELNGSDE